MEAEAEKSGIKSGIEANRGGVGAGTGGKAGLTGIRGKESWG